MDQPTTFAEIETNFHSMPLTKYTIVPELEQEWLKNAVADYELDLSCDLKYDDEKLQFETKLDRQTVRVLALMMYVCYLQRELSRVMALNGIYGKDVQITGTDATKRVTKQELESEMGRVKERLHKMKRHAFA
jgi:hypothetical protein